MLGAAYAPGVLDTDERIQGLKPPLDTRIRTKAKEVLVEEELSKRRYVNPCFPSSSGAYSQPTERYKFSSPTKVLRRRNRKKKSLLESVKFKKRRNGRVSLTSFLFFPPSVCIREPYLICSFRTGHLLEARATRFLHIRCSRARGNTPIPETIFLSQ